MQRPTRILLVEDNPADARLLREVLREAHTVAWEIRHVERLAEAREVLAAEPVDVVLLDLSLPDAHGLETIALTLEAAPSVPVVVLTGLDDEALALQAVQAGAQDYLIKGTMEPALFVRAVRYARERKRLLEREQAARATAEAAVLARDEVLRIVSHDIGNSLAGIGIHAKLLERALPEGEPAADARQRARAIRTLVEQLHGLRQDLLDVASIEAGRLRVEPEPQLIEPIVRDAVELHREMAADQEVELLCETDGGLPRVHADRERILQLLGNLLGNAIKHTPAGGRVVLRAEPEADWVRLLVADTGTGIAAEDLPHVFDRFWQARKRLRSGAGLGLAIVAGIAEAHGGEVGVESELGRGSTFWVRLPTA